MMRESAWRESEKGLYNGRMENSLFIFKEFIRDVADGDWEGSFGEE